MKTENASLVILFAALIVVLSNLLAYFLVQGGRGISLHWLQRLRQGFRLSSDEDQAWDELNRRVRELKGKQGKQEGLPGEWWKRDQ
ncbi:MAG: hypothetical protein ACK4VW_00420 [Anaerolineales bacterium]